MCGGAGGGEESMKDPGKRRMEARGGWVRRQFGVVVVESIDRLLIVVSE